MRCSLTPAPSLQFADESFLFHSLLAAGTKHGGVCRVRHVKTMGGLCDLHILLHLSDPQGELVAPAPMTGDMAHRLKAFTSTAVILPGAVAGLGEVRSQR